MCHGRYHSRHLSSGIWRGKEEATTAFEKLTDKLDINVREIIQEDFETMEHNVMRCNAKLCEFCDIPNIQISCVRKCLLLLESAKVATQLLSIHPEKLPLRQVSCQYQEYIDSMSRRDESSMEEYPDDSEGRRPIS